jgi:hypothetical protein
VGGGGHFNGKKTKIQNGKRVKNFNKKNVVKLVISSWLFNSGRKKYLTKQEEEKNIGFVHRF